MKKVILLSCLFQFVLISLYAQETIVTVDGQTISAYILKENAGFLFLGSSQNDSNSNLKLSKNEIDYIEYQNGYRRTFADIPDIRISKPASISAGLAITPGTDYGNLYGKLDYFITPRINYEIHAGVSWVATGVNYYFPKPDKNRSYFPYVGVLGGYDYGDYGSGIVLVPVGISKIFSSGLSVRVGLSGMLAFDEMEQDIFGEVIIGYRFK